MLATAYVAVGHRCFDPYHFAMPDAQHWIDELELDAHPEGGFYRETYRTDLRIPKEHLPPRFDGARNVAALIYFLLRSAEASALHRIEQDEVWHFYAGAPVTLHEIRPDGTYVQQTLSREVERGHRLQAVVPAGTWFGATIAAGSPDYALVGCTTAPAFDFSDFELGERAELLQAYPEHRDVIERLTRD